MIWYLVPSLLISVFGIFNIFGIKSSLCLNQTVYVVVGILFYFLIKKIGRNFFLQNIQQIYWTLLVILVITYIIGFEVKGSKRWIDLLFFNFQASEFLKPFFILFLADLFTRVPKYIDDLQLFIMSIFYFILPTFIIFKQPDLGNALVYIFIYLVMVLFSPVSKKYIVYFLLFVLVSLPFGWFFLRDYQKDRLLAFFNPHIDTQGTAYNMIQAIVTIGSGRFLGRGLGLGTQSRLFFLPENRTDFAFASLVEQFGFLGGFVVIILYLIVIVACIKKIIGFYFEKSGESSTNFLYVLGFSSYLFFQVLVNVGMNLGLLPITGIALPFISYGGSSIVALMIGMALIP